MSDNTTPQQAEAPASSTELEPYMSSTYYLNLGEDVPQVIRAIARLHWLNTGSKAFYDFYGSSSPYDLPRYSSLLPESQLPAPYYELRAGYGAMTSLLETLPEGFMHGAYATPLERIAISIARTVDGPTPGIFDRLKAYRSTQRAANMASWLNGKSAAADMLRRLGAFNGTDVVSRLRNKPQALAALNGAGHYSAEFYAAARLLPPLIKTDTDDAEESNKDESTDRKE